MNNHPHYIEHVEAMDAPHPGSAQYDADEARMGASWHDLSWHEDRPWLLTSCDVWVSNPHYYGPPNAPHPEDYDHADEDGLDAWELYRVAWWKAERAHRPHPLWTVFALSPVEADTINEDDIPF